MSCLHMFLLKQESHRLRNIKIIKGTAESCIYLNDLNDKHFNKGKNMWMKKMKKALQNNKNNQHCTASRRAIQTSALRVPAPGTLTLTCQNSLWNGVVLIRADYWYYYCCIASYYADFFLQDFGACSGLGFSWFLTASRYLRLQNLVHRAVAMAVRA